MSFEQYIMKDAYERVKGLGDRLELMKKQINWEQFREILSPIFHDNKKTGGRPHTDETIIVRCMLLQAWYGLSDPELEFQIADRLSFRNFVGFPETVPDFTTIWKIRERLKNSGKEDEIWSELQRQLKEKGLEITKGVIQDATFIEADQGRKRKSYEKKLKKEGKSPEYTDKQLSHIDKDGTYAVKAEQVHYGYKNHIKLDVDHHLIRDYDVSTASKHDSQVDLIEEGDGAAYRDKGYVGVATPKGVVDKTMKRATRGRKLNGGEQKRNISISRIRAPGERPFAVMKRVFNGGFTQVKRIGRVKVKEMFVCFAYNLYQLVTIVRKDLAVAR